VCAGCSILNTTGGSNLNRQPSANEQNAWPQTGVSGDGVSGATNADRVVGDLNRSAGPDSIKHVWPVYLIEIKKDS
jgi:hypothetical protein